MIGEIQQVHFREVTAAVTDFLVSTTNNCATHLSDDGRNLVHRRVLGHSEIKNCESMYAVALISFSEDEQPNYEIPALRRRQKEQNKRRDERKMRERSFYWDVSSTRIHVDST